MPMLHFITWDLNECDVAVFILVRSVDFTQG